MIYTVYVLESTKSQRLYIGQTNNFERRLKQHHDNKVVSTKNRGPWLVYKTIQLESRSEAMKLEIKLKKMKNPARAKVFLKKY